jgi:hypothetical protein
MGAGDERGADAAVVSVLQQDFIPGDPAACQRCALEAGDEGRTMPGTGEEGLK